MAKSLIEYETLDSNQIDDIMAGGKPRSNASEEKKQDKKDNKKDSSVGDPAEQN